MVAVALTNAGTREPAEAEFRVVRPDAPLAASGSEACGPASALDAALAETQPDTRPATGLVVAILVSLPLWVALFFAARMLSANF